MKQARDLTGKRYGMLLVLKRQDKEHIGHIKWECLCDCGVKTIVCGVNLKNGHTKSCGCLRTKTVVEYNTTHGGSHLDEYNIWQHMLNRCRNKNAPYYHRYGGRGISVCDRWKDFNNFLEDMGFRPSKKHSIDRIDVNGNYDPSNCRWTTSKIQQRNRANNSIYTYKGITANLSELCEIHGMKYTTVHRRLTFGADIETALEKKRLPRNTLNVTLKNLLSPKS